MRRRCPALLNEPAPARRGWSARSVRWHACTWGAAAAVALATAVACGNGNGPGGGSPISPSTGAPGTVAATITVANGAVSPQEVTIGVGQSVLFRNNDNRPREMTSDPHPTHTNCPAINAVGILQPGQERQTHGFGAAGTCGFHDHVDPDNPAVRGRIMIQ